MAPYGGLLQPPQFLLMTGELVPVAIAGQPHLDRAAREKGDPDIEIARQAEGAVQTLQLVIEHAPAVQAQTPCLPALSVLQLMPQPPQLLMSVRKLG